MVAIMNDYIAKIRLSADDVTKGILKVPLMEMDEVIENTILVKSNRFVVDIRLKHFSVKTAVKIMNYFMEKTRFHYSAYYIRFNEGDMVRYRYASCKESKEGFYCDVVIR